MWTFVLYDSETEELLISRDRFGIKPLYYYQGDQYFIFGSEIKALLKHPSVTKEPNIEYYKLFLKEGSKDHLRETAFKDIYRFECASFLKCKIEEIFQPFKETVFWSIQPNLVYEPYDEVKASEYTKWYYVSSLMPSGSGYALMLRWDRLYPEASIVHLLCIS